MGRLTLLAIPGALLGLILPGSAVASGPLLAAGPASSMPRPQAMVSGDFNGDGVSDIAATNYNAGTVSVALGNGRGLFTAAPGSPISLSHGVGPVAVDSFGNDTHLDLAVGNQIDGTVTVLKANGDGSFTQVTQLSTSCSPRGIATGDFNGDVVTDIAVAESCGQVEIFLGNPDGTFQTPASVSLPQTGGCTQSPYAILAGNFAPSNVNDHVDLAVLDGVGSVVDVLLGDGKGGFPTSPSGSPFATGETGSGCSGGFIFTTAESMTAGDFTGSGHQADLAVGFSDAKLSILTNDGTGRYAVASGSPTQIAPANTQILSLATGSFGSGHQGIAAGDYWQGGCGCILTDADWVSVLGTTGIGKLTPVAGSPYELSGVAGPVLAGTFAGDLAIPGAGDDVVASDTFSCHGNSVVTLINQGTRNTPSPPANIYPGDGCTIPPPSAVTGPAQSVSLTGATLTGTLATGYGSTITGCRFRYGLATNNDKTFTSSAPCSPTPAEGSSPSVSATLSGLAPTRRYQFDLVVTGPGGVAIGHTQYFQTCQAPEVMHGDLDATGCFTAGPGGTWTSTGPVRVNGVDFVPSSGQITIDPNRPAIGAQGDGTVKLAGGAGVRSWHGTLAIQLSGAFTLTRNAGGALFGFPLGGELRGQLQPDGEMQVMGSSSFHILGDGVQATVALTLGNAEGLVGADVGVGVDPSDPDPLDPHRMMFCAQGDPPKGGFHCVEVPGNKPGTSKWRWLPIGGALPASGDPQLMPLCLNGKPPPGYRCEPVRNSKTGQTSQRMFPVTPALVRIGGVLPVQSLDFSYDRTRNAWSGSAALALGDLLPGNAALRSALGGLSLTLGGEIGINPFQLDDANAAISGVAIPLGPASLQSASFDLRLHPRFGISGDAALSAGPEQAIAIDGGFDYRSGNKSGFDLKLHGSFAVKTISVSGYVEYNGTDGANDVLLGGSFTRSWGPVSATLGVGGGVQANPFHFQLTGDGSIDAFGASVGAHGIVSDAGVGACGEIHVLLFSGQVGFKHLWSGETDFNGCDFSGLYTVASGGAHDASASGRAFTLPRGRSREEIAVVAASGAPNVTLTGPGVTLRTPHQPNHAEFSRGAMALAVSDSKTTYFVVQHPHAGRWSITPSPGTPAPIRIELADPMAPLAVSARVTGGGAARTLSWRFAHQRGVTVRFIQQGGTPEAIATSAGGRGHRAFRIAPGPRGTRQIVAVVSVDGFPRGRLVVASFRAPAPALPRVARAAYKLHGSSLKVSWSRVRSSAYYEVDVNLTGGSLRLRVPGGAGAITITLPPRAGVRRVTVTTTGTTALTGPAVTASTMRPPRRRRQR